MVNPENIIRHMLFYNGFTHHIIMGLPAITNSIIKLLWLGTLLYVNGFTNHNKWLYHNSSVYHCEYYGETQW